MSESASISRILRRPAANAESTESVALLLGTAAFIVGGLVGLFVFWGRSLPISGTGSIGTFVAIGAGFVSLAAFVLGRVLLHSHAAAARADLHDGLEIPGARLHWFDVAALALAHAFIALLAWFGLADLLERSFIGAVVFPLPACVLAGVGLAVTAYVVFLSAINLTPMLLSLVLALFLVVGALASMLSSSDPHWWMKNLSALGMTDDISALAFNLTLIIAGVIVTTVAHYATATLPTSTASELRGQRLVRTGLVLIGVFLACVGIFPVDRFFILHNTVATGMAVVYGALVIGIRWLIPSMPRVFVWLGYVYIAVIVALAVFFAVGYYNLTAVELVAAILIFSWIIVFLRNAGATRTDGTEGTDGAAAVADADAEPSALVVPD